MGKKLLTAIVAVATLATVSCNNEDFTEQGVSTNEQNTEQAPNHLKCGFNNNDVARFHSELAEMGHIETKTDNEYVIPIVFHVFGTNQGSGMINQSRLEKVLKWINNDYNGVNNPGDTENYDNVHHERRQHVQHFKNIKFVLARFDPDGKKTEGYVVYDEEHPANKARLGNWAANSEIKKIAWSNRMYMNVYITKYLHDGHTDNFSGVAWLPDREMTNDNTARVVYNGSYLPAGTLMNKDFTSVISHEFGHFLGLSHTFNTIVENNMWVFKRCDSTKPDGGIWGDRVADTPQAEEPHYNTEYYGYEARNCIGQTIDHGNFMNYGTYCNFTKGQVDLMEQSLQHYSLQNLWTAENLKKTVYGDGTTPEPEPEPEQPEPVNENIDRINKGKTVIITKHDKLFPAIATNTEVSITNMYGIVVLDDKNYDGKFNTYALPIGTYYYAITLGSTVKKGAIEVI